MACRSYHLHLTHHAADLPTASFSARPRDWTHARFDIGVARNLGVPKLIDAVNAGTATAFRKLIWRL